MSERPFAVETRYGGHHFRSRLEARWAVFFDCLGIRYHYEPEKYQVGTERYIPDFFLPDLHDGGSFVEVKGPHPTVEEENKLLAVTEATGRLGFILYGSIHEYQAECYFWFARKHDAPREKHRWAACPFCGAVSLSNVGAPAGCRETCAPLDRFCREKDIEVYVLDFISNGNFGSVDWDAPAAHVRLALDTAIAARFENPLLTHEVENVKRSVSTIRSISPCPAEVLGQIHAAAAQLRTFTECPGYGFYRNGIFLKAEK